MQSVLENAIRLDLADALIGLPVEFENYRHSETYEAFIKRLIDKMRGDKWHALTKRASIIILVAALLFVLFVVGFAASATGREFIIKTFSDYFEYSILDKSHVKLVSDLQVKYLPEGYNLNYEEELKSLFYREYTDGTHTLSITKGAISATWDFDNYDVKEEFIVDGIGYVYVETEDIRRLIWNNGEYLYKVSGLLSKDELLKVAQNTD